jgi:hypothetical protein
MSDLDLSKSPQELLLLETDVSESVAALKVLLEDYEVYRLSVFNFASPETRINEIKRQLKTATPEQIPALHSELSGLVAGGMESKYNVRGKVEQAFNGCRTAIDALLQLIQTKLTGYRAAAQEAEDEFFARCGQPTQRTSLSKRFDDALRNINQFIAGSTNPIHTSVYIALPNGRELSIFTWLGVPQIATE